MIKKENLGLS